MLFRRLVPYLVALVVVPFLPVYPRYTMVRSQVMGHVGDVVQTRWHFTSLLGLFQDLGYLTPDEHGPALIAGNLCLGVVLAVCLGLVLRKLGQRVRSH